MRTHVTPARWHRTKRKVRISSRKDDSPLPLQCHVQWQHGHFTAFPSRHNNRGPYLMHMWCTFSTVHMQRAQTMLWNHMSIPTCRHRMFGGLSAEQQRPQPAPPPLPPLAPRLGWCPGEAECCVQPPPLVRFRCPFRCLHHPGSLPPGPHSCSCLQGRFVPWCCVGRRKPRGGTSLGPRGKTVPAMHAVVKPCGKPIHS